MVRKGEQPLKNYNLVLYRIVVLLLLLVIITFSLVSNRFARYMTNDAGSNGADVASFDVGISYGRIIDNGLTKVYPITLSNDSEVLVGFNEIVLQFPEALPKNITLALIDGEGNLLCPEQRTDSQQLEFIFPYSARLESQTSVFFQLQLTQDERGIFDAYSYTTRLFVTVFQID